MNCPVSEITTVELNERNQYKLTFFGPGGRAIWMQILKVQMISNARGLLGGCWSFELIDTLTFSFWEDIGFQKYTEQLSG